ncbi:MAG: hypothetical protein ACYTFE_07030 [Planctomycetota bacterium]|jgi:hypothetical protein
MKRTAKKILVFGTALTLLGGQIAFAADQVRNQTRSRVKNQTCINDGSGSRIKYTNQNRNMKQNRNIKQNKKGSGKALQSGK